MRCNKIAKKCNKSGDAACFFTGDVIFLPEEGGGHMRKKTGPGVRDIAAELGLNISTVSRALNRSYLISRDTTELVLRKAHEMGYHFERARKCIVVLLPSSRTELAWYSLSLINALQKRLSETPYYWEFVNEDKADIIQERSVSGIISLEFTLRIAGMINRKYNIPLVCINNASSHTDNAWSVNSDAENGIRKAFRCLHEYGHRRIAFIATGGTSFVGGRRRQAFEKVVDECGLRETCIFVPGDVESCHGIVLDLYRRGITGIIADGESVGLGIWNSLNFCKIEIPRRMSLVAWEVPYVSRMVRPAITTVEQDFNLIAEKAVALLEARFRGETPGNDLTVPYRLHMRETVHIPRDV